MSHIAQHQAHVVLDEQDADAALGDDVGRGSSPNCSVSSASRPEDGSSSSRKRNAAGDRPGQLDQPALPGRQVARPVDRRRCVMPQSSIASAAAVARSRAAPTGGPKICRGARGPDVARLAARARRSPRTVSESKSSMRWNVRPSPSRARRLRAERRDVDAVEEHPAACRPQHPAAGVERRGLAGTVRADQPGDRAASAAERHLVHGEQAAEPHGYADHREPGYDRRSRRAHATPSGTGLVGVRAARFVMRLALRPRPARPAALCAAGPTRCPGCPVRTRRSRSPRTAPAGSRECRGADVGSRHDMRARAAATTGAASSRRARDGEHHDEAQRLERVERDSARRCRCTRANSAPPIPAKKADRQNTMTRVTVTPVPRVARPRGESAIPRSSRRDGSGD